MCTEGYGLHSSHPIPHGWAFRDSDSDRGSFCVFLEATNCHSEGQLARAISGLAALALLPCEFHQVLEQAFIATVLIFFLLSLLREHLIRRIFKKPILSQYTSSATLYDPLICETIFWVFLFIVNQWHHQNIS